MKSLLIFVLVVSGTYGQGDIWDDDDPAGAGGNSNTQTQVTPVTKCTVSGAQGNCVPSRAYCKTPHSGENAVTWRSSTLNPCGTGICCKVSDVIPTSTTDTTTTGTPTPTPPSSTSSPTTPPTYNNVGPTGCGIQKLQQVSGYVKTRTNEADPGEFPWSVSLLIMTGMVGNRGRYQYAGTGSLINERVVLTAAHVLNNKDVTNLRAILGEHDQTKFNILAKKAVEASEVVMHPNFKSANGDYNFALVFLKSWPVASLPHVGTVCLPPASYLPTAGTRCFISGWGVDSESNPQQQLTKTEVPIVTHYACQEKLRQNSLLGPGFQLLSSYTCAGGEEGKDICGGAGGSPLSCPIENQQSRYVQTGIVSWVTKGCGVNGDPTVFADVTAARAWIDEQFTQRQYSTSSYTY